MVKCSSIEKTLYSLQPSIKHFLCLSCRYEESRCIVLSNMVHQCIRCCGISSIRIQWKQQIDNWNNKPIIIQGNVASDGYY